MNKISPEFLPPSEEKRRLIALLEQKSTEYDNALGTGNIELVQKIEEEAQALITEMTAFHPEFQFDLIDSALIQMARKMNAKQIQKDAKKNK